FQMQHLAVSVEPRDIDARDALVHHVVIPGEPDREIVVVRVTLGVPAALRMDGGDHGQAQHGWAGIRAKHESPPVASAGRRAPLGVAASPVGHWISKARASENTRDLWAFARDVEDPLRRGAEWSPQVPRPWACGVDSLRSLEVRAR